MGFFDRFAGKKNEPAPAPSPAPANSETELTAGGVLGQLITARENLEAKSLEAAVAIYTEVLAVAGDRADVLVTISGDLGANGHLAPIIELVAPLYDATRHGPATGVHLLQAYLALRQTDAAQHVLDILFTLNRPELEERLHGFSNQLAELLLEESHSLESEPGGGSASVAKVALVTISKPIWYYGLEGLAAEILPAKSGRRRRLAFGQLAWLGVTAAAASQEADDDLARWARGIPLWFAESFQMARQYEAVTAVALLDHPTLGKKPVIFPHEWKEENLQQLVNTSKEPLDYIMTGALRRTGDNSDLTLRLWEVKRYRERKQFSATWTAATMDEALTAVHGQVSAFMEWQPAPGLAYSPPASPRSWLESLDALLNFFLAEKSVTGPERLPALGKWAETFSAQAAESPIASLAWLQFARGARKSNLDVDLSPPPLADSELVRQAQACLATPAEPGA